MSSGTDSATSIYFLYFNWAMVEFNSMISKFPKFKSLSLKDKKSIELITSTFPPYSDFNFISMWAWNIDNAIEISILNNNLVVKFQNYSSADLFYSFIGKNKPINTAQKLLNLSIKKGLNSTIRLIPFHNFSESEIYELKKDYYVYEDLSHNDYILDVKKLVAMEGKALHQKRKLLNRFLKSYESRVIFKSLSDQGVKDEILNFSYSWEKNRNIKMIDAKNELRAIKMLFTLPKLLNVFVQCVYVNDSMVGFTVFEIIKNQYAVSNFQKGDIIYKGIYEFLYSNMANFLAEKGCKYINIQQDLGIEGLRRSKLDYRPISFLKKYLISFKQLA